MIHSAESELLSIDGPATKEIIQRLFQYIQNLMPALSRIKNWELPEYFQLLYCTMYDPAENFTISHKTKTGHIQTTTLHADL